MLRIYGASDDLIEIEGDLTEEFSPPGNEEDPSYLAFSDGTVLSIAYTGGFWRINRVAVGGATYTKTEGMDEDDDYSDVAVLDGPITWVVFGRQFEKIKPAT